MKRMLIWLVGLGGLALAQDGLYKLRVSEWRCAPSASGVVVAQGTVVNQSGRTLNNLRVNLRVVDSQVRVVNGVPNRKVYGTNSAPIALRTLPSGAQSRFEVQVKPIRSQGVRCQIWFRSSDMLQIPTLVPGQ